MGSTHYPKQAPAEGSPRLVDLALDWMPLCFIARSASGVQWTNQTAGVLCDHPRLEGVLIPLPDGWLPSSDPLLDVGYTGTKRKAQKWITAFLTARPKGELQKLFAPDPSATFVSEAWVPVVVRANDHPLLRDFVGARGVLTYPNSD